MASGLFDKEQSEDLFRDAHTIKGSSRVMGFVEMGEAARILEATWRDIADGMLEPGEVLGERLQAVAAEFEPAIALGPDAQPETLQVAVDNLQAFLSEPTTAPTPQPAPVPGPATVPLPPPPKAPAAAKDAMVPELTAPELVDLGGLLATVESGLVGQVTRVETTKLYRLINRAAEVRLDASALAAAVQGLRMAVAGNPREVAALASRWEAAVETLDLAVQDLQQRALQLVAAPLSEITETMPQFVRYLARRTGKQVRFELSGEDVEVDRQIVEHLREPLRHLIVNAVDHGAEASREREEAGKSPTVTVALRAQVTGNRLIITVEDDGCGIDWEAVLATARERGLVTSDNLPPESELARLLYSTDFSTSLEATDLSGDGSGLTAVAETAEMLNGGISLQSRKGHGTSVMLTLPASWALQDVLLLEAEGHTWGIPAATVVASFALSGAEVRPGPERMELIHQSSHLPISSFATAVGLTETEPAAEVVVLATRVGQVAVTVPKVIGRRQVAVKGLGPLLAGVPHLTGAAVLGGGEVVVVVESNQLGERVRSLPSPVLTRPRVLIVDDSRGARQLVSSVLTGQGFETLVAADANEGLAHLQSDRFDALVVDYAMPGPNGVELVRTVRNILPALPIVMVSAVAKPQDQAQAWSAGVNAYLDKADLRQGALASTLHSLLEMRAVAQSEAQTEVTG